MTANLPADGTVDPPDGVIPCRGRFQPPQAEVVVNQRSLVLRAQRGDHDAFSTLARTAVGRLGSASRLILRDPELARDAVQEALIKAWRDLPGLRDPDQFEAWLYRLSHRKGSI